MADGKKLTGALQDVRKMRRSLRLRKEQDPEVVSETLSTILREAIAVRSATGGRLGKGAVNELRNIRRALIAGQIDSGSKSAEFVGKYSMIIDQIAETETKVKKEAKQSGQSGDGVGQAIAQNLPSADMITSALITANPLMGYSVKIAKDVFSAGKRRRRVQKDLEQRELENLNKEEKKLEEEMDSAKERGDVQAQADIGPKLDMIRDEIHALVRIWSDGDEKLERIVQETEQGSSKLEQSTDATNEKLERIASESEETNRLEREQQSTSDLMRSEREYERSSFGAGSRAADNLEKNLEETFDIQDGILSGFGGAIGGFTGAIASKIFAPFLGLYRFITKGSSILGRFARVGGLITAAYAIYDFVDGFANAGDILDKEESEVTITDRLRVGTASIISGLLSPVDWVLDFFDMGFMEDKDSFTSKIANSSNELLQFMLSPGAWIIDYIKNFNFDDMTKDLKESIMGPVDEFVDFFDRIGKSITGWIDEQYQKFMNTWIGQKAQKFFDALDQDNSVTRGIEESGVYYPGGGADAEALAERRRTIESPRITSQALETALNIANQFNPGSASGASPMILAPNNSSTSVINNNTVSGSSSSLNEDRTIRRFEEKSGGFMGW